MSTIWTAIKNLFARKNADADSSKEKANGQKENQKVQRKHTYDEIDIKDNEQAGSSNAIRVHPYDSIEVDEGKVSVQSCSSETFCSLPTITIPICLNNDKFHYAELDFGEKEKKKGKKGKSGKSVKIIGAGSSVDYTEIQIQHS
ncbi:hypothetical protein CHS0354_013423 [Potamilus streckersoni]|uniref:Uncharacterized protein n=1 Tax=Potamilus streckersoni TaxID=2493646 RepID=A0AAE0RV92_9BIVA|nr:hypothetical protein CHS0354_013423 [Potamilus streckersoni]